VSASRSHLRPAPGRKLRTQLDIARNESCREAIEAQVFQRRRLSYATLESNLILLRPYKAKYLAGQSVRGRDTIPFLLTWWRVASGFLTRKANTASVTSVYFNLIGHT